MHAAAALGDVVAVRRMLAESVLPDEGLRGAGPGSSCTPLNLCCASELGDIRDREACVAALLKAGADPNNCSPFGPMYHAQRFGRERILAMLIMAGGSVKGGHGLSPFVPAILRRLKRTYPYFLQAGAVIPTSDELRRISWGDDHKNCRTLIFRRSSRPGASRTTRRRTARAYSQSSPRSSCTFPKKWSRS